MKKRMEEKRSRWVSEVIREVKVKGGEEERGGRKGSLTTTIDVTSLKDRDMGGDG